MQFGHSKEWRRRGPYQSSSSRSDWNQRSSHHSSANWQRSYDPNRRDWSSHYYHSGSQHRQHSRSLSYGHHRQYYQSSSNISGRISGNLRNQTRPSYSKASDSEEIEKHQEFSNKSREHIGEARKIDTSSEGIGTSSEASLRYSGRDTSAAVGDSFITSPFSFSPTPKPSHESIKSIPSSVIRDPRFFSKLSKIVKAPEATIVSQAMPSVPYSASSTTLEMHPPCPTTSSTFSSDCTLEMSFPRSLTPKEEPKEMQTEAVQKTENPLVENSILKLALTEEQKVVLPPLISAEEIKKEIECDFTPVERERNETPLALAESVPVEPPVTLSAIQKTEKPIASVPLIPQVKMQSIVKESFLKLKQEGRAKMSAPSKGDSKQSQALLKLVMGSEASLPASLQKTTLEAQKPISIHNMAKFAGIKTILNSVMKTSISQVLRTKLDSKSESKTETVDNLKADILPAAKCNSKDLLLPKSNDHDASKEVTFSLEGENGNSSPVRARKSFPPVKDSVESPSPSAGISGGKRLQKALVKSIKKQRKKFFKGGTYSLYLSKKKKKKHHLRDEESSITGTETTGSIVDSEDEAGLNTSDISLRDDSLSKHEGEDDPYHTGDEKSDDETENGSVTLEGVEAGKELEKQNLDDISDTKEDAARLPTEEPAIPESGFKLMEEGVVTRRQQINLLNKENLSEKDGLQSIALNVKQRQRLKRRYMEDQMDVDIVSIASSEGSGSLAKRARRAANLGAEETHLSTELSEITNGFVPNLEILYHPKLPAVMRCCCQDKALDVSSEDVADDAKIYCQAVDSIGSKLVGCCNTVTTKHLVRPSMRIPFTAMCEVHLWRLRYHQCCPTCSVFCSEGRFFRCRSTVKDRVRIHLFHKHCKIVQNGMSHCPHCGSTENIREISLELNLPSPPTFYLSQKPIVIEPKARMTFSKQPVAAEVDETPAVSIITQNQGKVLTSAGLPSGPCRDELESLLEKLKEGELERSQFFDANLHKAAKSGDVETTLKMLILDFDPNVKTGENEKEIPLHAAAAGAHLAIIHLLVQAGASIDTVDEHLYTPLMQAVENKSVAVVRYLIKAGAQLDAKGEDGMCGLHLAARGGNLDICRAFLDTGRVNVNVQDDGGWTPIVWAAEHRHLTVVRLLIERGADPNIRDNELNNALHWSSYSGNVEISHLFLDLGLKLTDVNEHGDTPLHIASRQNNYECVVLFLARGSQIDAKNKENQMPVNCCSDSQSETYIALTMNYELKRIATNRPLQAERVIFKDISRGKELNPIQCVNGEDSEPVPTDFLYVTENCETSPISIDRTITSLQSCQCEDDCTSSTCTCATISFKCWYDNDGRLLPEFNLPDPPMIFECNRACLCWKNCNNRALQHGMMSRLQLFKTRGKGWGVRTLKDIPRGTFVCEYIGEIISDNEADQREDDSYLFDLDNRDGETFCLDARYYGNVSRFINHLCEPNLVPVKIFVEHQDLSFPRIAFFSSRDIRADEELGFDYGEKFWVIKYKWFTCTCGSPKCKYSETTIHETLENFRKAKDEHVEEDVVVHKGTW